MVTQRNKKILFSWIYPGKTLLGLECTINPKYFNKIVGAIFEKIKIFYFFFLCELTLILGVEEKLKKKKNCLRYLRVDPRYQFWMRSVNWFRLYIRRRTGRHTHRHFFIKHILILYILVVRCDHIFSLFEIYF